MRLGEKSVLHCIFNVLRWFHRTERFNRLPFKCLKYSFSIRDRIGTSRHGIRSSSLYILNTCSRDRSVILCLDASPDLLRPSCKIDEDGVHGADGEDISKENEGSPYKKYSSHMG